MLKFIIFLWHVWAMIYGVKMDKIVKVGTNLQRLNRGMALLNKKMDNMVSLYTKMNKFNKGQVVLDSKTYNLMTGLNSKVNLLNNGVSSLSTKWNKITGFHTKMNRANQRMTALTDRMDKLIMKIRGGRDCADICSKGIYPSGIYTISPNGKTKFQVYCDMNMAGGGWTVLQKRVDSSVDFYRTWNEYKRGFGNLHTNFWLGNDKLYLLTHISGRTQRLRVDLWDKKGNTRFAQYSKFMVDSETRKYKLTIGSYSGNAGNDLSYHNGVAFSTKDRDNDSYGGNCAAGVKGAWWFKSCLYSHLNGKYLNGKHGKSWHGIIWYKWKGNYYSYPHVEMKIRPVGFSGCRK